MPSRVARVIEQKAPLKLGEELARDAWDVVPGEAVLWAGEQHRPSQLGRDKRRARGKAKGATATTRAIER